MLLKLTNAAKGRVGDGLILNTELMVSFFDHTNKDEQKVTSIFGVGGNAWEVQETIDEIMEQING